MPLVQKWPDFQLFFFRQCRLGKCLLRYSRTRKRASRLIKNKFNKSKNWHFFKGVDPWFWSKNGLYSNFFSLGNIGKENVFCDILERKNFLLGYKNKKFKNSKNWHLCKGVIPCFWSKNGLFSNFFSLGNIGQEHVFYDILERKNAFLDYKKKNFKKAKNSHFSKGVNPWFWSRNGHFSNFFSLGNIGQENVFYDILERKSAFLGYKNNKFKKSTN